MKKFFFSFAIFILTLSALPAEKSIVILFDSSFSMNLPISDNGERRIDMAKEMVRKITSSFSREKIEWALVTFGSSDDGSDTPELKVAFTRESKKINDALRDLSPWGVSRIDKALVFASRYLKEKARGKERDILLISDCMETGNSSPDLADFISFTESGGIRYPLYILWFPPGSNKILTERIERSIESFKTLQHSDLFLARYNDTEKLITRIKGKEELSSADKPSSFNTEKGIKASNFSYFPFILILSLLVLLPLSFAAILIFLKPYRTEKKRSGVEYHLKLEIVSSEGKRETREFSNSPVTIGTAGDEDLYLSHPGKTVKKLSCFIHFNRREVFFKSPQPFIVDGVERREKKLKIGNFFRFGSYRIFYRGIEEVPAYTLVKKAPIGLIILYMGVFILLTSILLILPPPRKPSRQGANRIPTGTEIETKVKRGKLETVRTAMYRPGERIEYFKADILFFHAHPDDESLDFGCLMAESSRKGKNIATVLFTDGESGLDQFPNRTTGDIYPPYKMHGRELSSVRVLEARDALSILGSRAYIRLGLKNHPYDSITEILPLDRILEDWGGERRVVEQVKEIIRGFRPELIVSPDRHSRAFEHFEHEAVGYVVRKAIEELKEEGYSYPKGYIVSVDPLQRSKYSYVITLNAMATDERNNYSYREIQELALLQHVTQRDASIIGVEILPNFEKEYYHPVKWEIEDTLENYIDK